MAYNIIVSPAAQKEIENAVEFYVSKSNLAPINFIKAIQDTYETLALNPFFRLRYKNVRALRIKKFPYSLYFVINEDKNIIRILSCFHNRRNPKKRPKNK